MLKSILSSLFKAWVAPLQAKIKACQANEIIPLLINNIYLLIDLQRDPQFLQ